MRAIREGKECGLNPQEGWLERRKRDGDGDWRVSRTLHKKKGRNLKKTVAIADSYRALAKCQDCLTCLMLY